MTGSRFSLIFSLILFTFCLTTRHGVAQTSIEEIVITDIDHKDFPQIYVRFRALDSSQRSVPGLLGDSLSINENGEPMRLDSLEEVEEGVWLQILVDAGGGMTADRWEKTQEALLNFVQSTPWMADGLDKVAITAIEASGPRTLIYFSSDAEAIAEAIEDYQPPGGDQYSSALVELDNMLESLNLNKDAAGQAKSILLFTPGLEKMAGQAALQETIDEKEIPIHTVLVRSDERIPCRPPVTNDDGTVTVPACDETVRLLATDSEGIYTHLVDRNSLNDLYQFITNQRVQYEASYRSYLKDSGTRHIEVGTAGGDAVTKVEGAYDIEVNPARVSIERPSEGFIIERKSDRYIEDLSELPGATYKIVANVVFPDNLRRLLRATLLVDGEVQSMVDNPGSNIELSWDLPDATKTGDTDYNLQVAVEDELGIVSTSLPIISKVRITVPQPPPLISSTLEPLPTPTGEIPESSPTPVPPPKPPIPGWSNSITILGFVITLLGFGVAALIIYIYRNSGPGISPIDVVRGITKRVLGQGDPRAYLKVLSGERGIDQPIPLYGTTTLGSVRGHSEILFHQDDKGRIVSGLHCTLIDDEDRWLIQDEQSTNGTFLDGDRLKPLIEEELHDEAIIELAPKYMGGVEIQFLIAEDDHDTRRS